MKVNSVDTYNELAGWLSETTPTMDELPKELPAVFSFFSVELVTEDITILAHYRLYQTILLLTVPYHFL